MTDTTATTDAATATTDAATADTTNAGLVCRIVRWDAKGQTKTVRTANPADLDAGMDWLKDAAQSGKYDVWHSGVLACTTTGKTLATLHIYGFRANGGTVKHKFWLEKATAYAAHQGGKSASKPEIAR